MFFCLFLLMMSDDIKLLLKINSIEHKLLLQKDLKFVTIWFVP